MSKVIDLCISVRILAQNAVEKRRLVHSTKLGKGVVIKFLVCNIWVVVSFGIFVASIVTDPNVITLVSHVETNRALAVGKPAIGRIGKAMLEHYWLEDVGLLVLG